MIDWGAVWTSMQKNKRGKKDIDFLKLFKKSLALSLTVAIFGIQTSYATNITAGGGYNTNVETNGNTTNITGGLINNGTGFHHFTDFDVSRGDIANLIFAQGADRYVNLVDKQVSIYGIFNSIKGGNIGGDVIFVSPLGMIVGASGVMNVGSLQTITPVQGTYNSLLDLGTGISYENNIQNLKSDINNVSMTNIQGKIFASDSIDLSDGRNLMIGSNASLVTGFNENGFAKTSVTGFNMNDIVNSDGIVAAEYMSGSGGDIKLAAATVNATGGVIQSQGNVSFDAYDGAITVGSKVVSDGNVDIGVNSSATTRKITINNDITALGDVNVTTQNRDVVQNTGSNISASKVNISSGKLGIDGNIKAQDGIDFRATEFTQGDDSSIVNKNSGNISISATSDISSNKITNEAVNGNINIAGSEILLKDTIKTNSGSIEVSATSDISQSDDSFNGFDSAKNLNITADYNVGSSSQSLNLNVAGNVNVYGAGSDVYLASKDSDLRIENISNAQNVSLDSSKAINVSNSIDANDSVNITSQEGFNQSESSTISVLGGNGDVSIKNNGSGDVNINNVNNYGNGNVVIENTNSGSAPTPGNVNFSGNVYTQGEVSVSSDGSILQANNGAIIDAQGNVNLSAQDSIGTKEQTVVISSGGSVIADAVNGGVNLTGDNTDIELVNINAGTDYNITVTGNNDIIFNKDLSNVNGDLSFAVDNDLNIDSSITASGDVSLTSNKGDVILNALVSSTGESVDLNAQGGIYQGDSFDNVAINANKDITLNAQTGNVGAEGNSLQMTAGGVVDIEGGNIYIQSPGSLNIANINSSKDAPDTVVNITTTTTDNGNINFSGAIKGSDVNVNAAQGISQSVEGKTIDASGNLSLTAQNGSIGETNQALNFSAEAVSASASKSVVLTGIDTDIRTSQIQAQENIDLSTKITSEESEKGSIIVENDLIAQDGYIKLDSAKNLEINNNLSAGNSITLNATGGITQSSDASITSGTSQSAAQGSGNILISNNGTGDIVLHDVTSSKGDISVVNNADGADIILNSVLQSTDSDIILNSENNIIQTSKDSASLLAAGDIVVNAINAGSQAGELLLNAGGSLYSTSDNLYVRDTDGDLTLGVLNITDNANITAQGNIIQDDASRDSIVSQNGVINLVSTGGDIGADNGLSLNVGGRVNADASNIYLKGTNVSTGLVNADNAVTIDTTASNGTVNIKDKITAGSDININSAKDVTLNAGDAPVLNSTGGNVIITAVNDISQTGTAESILAAGNISLTSTTGSVGTQEQSMVVKTTAGSLGANAAAGSVYLTGIDTNISSSDITAAKDIDLTVTGSGNILIDEILNTNDGYIKLTTDNGIDINNLISASKDVTIDAKGGSVTQAEGLDKAISAGGNLSISAHGDIGGAENQHLSVTAGGKADLTGDNVYLKSPESNLTLGSVNSSGVVDIKTETSGNINLDGLVTGSQVSLNAADGIYQSAQGKTIDTQGSLSLIANKESIGQKGSAISFSAGSVSADAAKSVVLLGENTDINTQSVRATENIDLTTTGTGKITISNELSTRNGYINLDSAQNLDIQHNLSAGEYITLNANGGIVQHEGAKIESGTSSAVTDGSITVTNSGTGGIQLSDGITSHKGNITVTNNASGENANIEITSAVAYDGTVNITNGSQNNDIILGSIVSDGQNGEVNIDSAGQILGSGSIFSSGDVNLNALSNIGASSSLLGISASGNVNAAGDNIYLGGDSGAFNVGDIAANNTVRIENTGTDININGSIQGSDVILKAQNNILQTSAGKTITADNLELFAANGNIGSIGQAIAFEAGTVKAEAVNGSVILNGIDTTINTGSIKAGSNIDLSTTGSGDINVDEAINANGYIALNAADNLNVNQGITSSDTITLTAADNVHVNSTVQSQNDLSVNTQGGDISLGALLESTTGSVELNSGGNISQTFDGKAVQAANGITIDAVGDIASAGNELQLNTSGVLNADASNIYIKNNEGGLNIGLVDAENNIKLSAAGNITSASSSSSVNAGGNIDLNAADGYNIGTSSSDSLKVNADGVVNAKADNIYLSSDNDLNTGIITAASVADIRTTGTDKNINITDLIKASDVYLEASGSVLQNSVLAKTIETNNLTLIANNGSIGATGNAIDFSATGLLRADASEAVVLNGVGRDIDTSSINAGTSIDLSTEGSGKIIVSSNLTANNGYISLNAADGLDLKNYYLTASDYINLVAQSGDILLNSMLNAGTYITIDSAGDILQSVDAVTLTAGTDITLKAGGTVGELNNALQLKAQGNVNAQGADIYLTSPETDINLGNINASNNISIKTETNNSNININGTITGNNITLDANNNISQTSQEKTITASNDLNLISRNGNIGTTDNAIIFEAGTITAEALNGSVVLNGIDTTINTGSIKAGSNIDLSTTGSGDINVDKEINANGYISLDAADNLNVNEKITSNSEITLAASDKVLLGALVESTNGNITVNANSGSIEQNFSGVALKSGNDITLSGAQIGSESQYINTDAANKVNADGTNIYIESDRAVFNIGNINTNPDIVNQTVNLRSNTGDVNFKNTVNGNIVNINTAKNVTQDASLNKAIDATTVNFTAQNGNIGAENNAIDIKASDRVNISQAQNAYINGVEADLNTGNINVDSNAKITSDNGIHLVDKLTAQNVNLSAQGDITQDSELAKSIEAQSLILNSASGDIGKTDNAIAFSANSLSANAQNGSVVLKGIDTDIYTSSIEAGKNIDLSTTGTAGITIDEDTLSANGYIRLDSAQGLNINKNVTASDYVELIANNGSVLLNSVISGTDVTVSAADGITQTGGELLSSGVNGVTVSNSASGGITLTDVTAQNGNISVANNASGDADVVLGTLSAGGNIDVVNNANGELILNDTLTGSDISLTSQRNIVQTTDKLGVKASNNLTLSAGDSIGTQSQSLIVNAGKDVSIEASDIYLESPDSDLNIVSINANREDKTLGAVEISTSGSTGDITLGDSIVADEISLYSAGSVSAMDNLSANTVSITANDNILTNGNVTAQDDISIIGGSITQNANTIISSQNGDISLSAMNGDIVLNGDISSTNGRVSVSNTSTGNASVTVNNVSAGDFFAISNNADGLVTVNGTLTGGNNSLLNAQNSGSESGIVVSENAVINSNGTFSMYNAGDKGILLDGKINNAQTEGSSVTVVNDKGSIHIKADVDNGESNSFNVQNNGTDADGKGLVFENGIINNYGTLVLENNAGSMTLDGVINAYLGSDNSFVNGSDSDFHINGIFENRGNTVTFENKGAGSLIVDEDAVLSVYSIQDSGNVYTGVLNLLNNSTTTNGGGVTINGTINNGSNMISGGILNIVNDTNGGAGDYGILISDTGVINNYAELNINNNNTNGNASGGIVINGNITGDKGTILTPSAGAPIPSNSVNISNNAQSAQSGIEFGTTSNVDVKGNKLNITNNGQKGITFKEGSSVSNTDTLTVNNLAGSLNIENNATVKSGSDLTLINSQAGNSVNIDGTVHGKKVTVQSTGSNVNIAHNNEEGNIISDSDVTINVTGGDILNHSDSQTALENAQGIKAAGNIELNASNIGETDSSLSDIVTNGFDNLNPDNAIHFTAGGKVTANAENNLNLLAMNGDMNIDTVKAGNAVLSALNGNITASSIDTTGNLYMYAKADSADIIADSVKSALLSAEAGRNIDINSPQNLDIESMLSRNGSINLDIDGDSYIREIAAAKDITINADGEKLTIVNLGRVERNDGIIPETVNLTVTDSRNTSGSKNSKLDIYNGYVRDKVTLKADTITAQAYDISDSAQKGDIRKDSKYGIDASGFHNANTKGELLEFDIQGANYSQKDAGSNPNNPYYKPDENDKHALNVHLTLGDSVGDAQYGANFKKLYSDYVFIDSINKANPDAFSKIVVESGIIGEYGIFRNNNLRLDINNNNATESIVDAYPINKHYDDKADKTVSNNTSFYMEMGDSINIDVPYNPDVPVDPITGKIYNPHRNVEDPELTEKTKAATAKDADNSAVKADSSTGIRQINWVIRDKDNEILGASEHVEKPVIQTLLGISKKGLLVVADKNSPELKKGEKLHIDMKYKDVAFNVDGKVKDINGNVVEISFVNTDKLTSTIMLFLSMYQENL